MGHYAERRDSFRYLLEEICELCGLSAKMSPRALLGAAAGYSCTAEEFWNMDFMEKDMKVFLEKEPDNDHDREAIKVTMEGLGLVGYVANSAFTVLGESYSAGRLYDKIGDTASGKILYVLDKGVLCELDEESVCSR